MATLEEDLKDVQRRVVKLQRNYDKLAQRQRRLEALLDRAKNALQDARVFTESTTYDIVDQVIWDIDNYFSS